MAQKGSVLTWAQYLAARLVAMGIAMFDADATLQLARSVGRTAYRLDRRHAERMQGHIARSFPHWEPGRVEATARKAMEHVAQLGVEVVHTPRVLLPHRFADRVRFREMGPAIERLGSGRPTVLVTGHQGNWEVLGYTLAVLGYDIDALARPLDNPLIDRWLLGIRRRRGMRIITKFNAIDAMRRVLQRGGSLAFVADQNAGERGLYVPFFGRLASTYRSIGLMAMRYRAPVICGYAHRIGDHFRYEVGVTDVIDPEDWQDRDDPLYYITARYSRAIETMVRMCPEQYLWVHRRWKSRPLFEQRGQAMPPELRHQLRSLPWLTPSEIERLEAGERTT